MDCVSFFPNIMTDHIRAHPNRDSVRVRSLRDSIFRRIALGRDAPAGLPSQARPLQYLGCESSHLVFFAGFRGRFQVPQTLLITLEDRKRMVGPDSVRAADRTFAMAE